LVGYICFYAGYDESERGSSKTIVCLDKATAWNFQMNQKQSFRPESYSCNYDIIPMNRFPTDVGDIEKIITKQGWLEDEGSEVVVCLGYLLVADFQVTPKTLAPYARELLDKLVRPEADLMADKCDAVEICIHKGEVRVWRVFYDAYWVKNPKKDSKSWLK